jgi:hypothetical protein
MGRNGQIFPKFQAMLLGHILLHKSAFLVLVHESYCCAHFQGENKKRLRDKTFAKSVSTRWRRKEDIAEAFTSQSEKLWASFSSIMYERARELKGWEFECSLSSEHTACVICYAT